jgi:hypothetical protein
MDVRDEDAPPEFLAAFLAGRDAACPGCGYNLRDLQGTRCPECGEGLVVRIGLVEPKQAAPIAGLICLAAGAGLNGLLLLYIVIQMAIVRVNFYGVERFLVINSIGFIVQAGAMGLWLLKWRSIWRLAVGRRWAWVIACWVLTLSNLVAFALNVH